MRAELRWQRTGANEGTAVVLSEEALAIEGAEPKEYVCAGYIEGVRQLLWGTVGEVEKEWSELQGERRIKPYWFPVGSKRGVDGGASLALVQREYIVRGSDHGNAQVRWTRYLDVEVLNASQG